MRGPLAHSHFRIERLLAQIHRVVPQVNNLHAEFVHLINLEDSLTKEENRTLSNLLEYGSYSKEIPPDPSTYIVIVVVPKVGTVSPWSSKAIEILKFCGLKQIQRIERGIVYYLEASEKLTWGDEQAIAGLLHDPKCESVFYQSLELEELFQTGMIKPLKWVDLMKEGRSALKKANAELMLKLTESEIDDQLRKFLKLNRNPSDVELKMSVQSYQNDLSIPPHNIAIVEGKEIQDFFAGPSQHIYGSQTKLLDNAIFSSLSPYYTSINLDETIKIGSSIEQGSKPKARICGFNTLNLCIPGFIQAWEDDEKKFTDLPLPVEIMLEIPKAYAQFNNEFGCPTVGGYFRTYEGWECGSTGEKGWGYFKPLLLSGGVADIWPLSCIKATNLEKMVFVVLGGPSILTGPSFHSNDSAEMQRRCQEVINRCIELDQENPIFSIRFIDIKGLGNTLLELLQYYKIGGYFNLRDIPIADSTLSPLEIWCSEIGESYVIMIEDSNLECFEEIAIRECCPFAIIGKTIPNLEIQLFDKLTNNFAVNLPIESFIKNSTEKKYEIPNQIISYSKFRLDKITLEEAAFKLLKLPCIADKSFLIQICDRTVNGLVVRDPMVGPWQVPVADCGVTASSFNTYQGEATALGERPLLAMVNPAASIRMAIGEAITNIAAANISALSDIKLLANWNISHASHHLRNFYKVVETIGVAFCTALGLTLMINQNFSSLPIIEEKEEKNTAFTEPISFIIQAIAPVIDVRFTATPLLTVNNEATALIFIDLSKGRQRLGQSALAQVSNQIGGEVPDIENPNLLISFFKTLQQLRTQGKILAYHDRSDGGLFVTLCEMAFASHVGLSIDISELGLNSKSILFNEELGAVIQVTEKDVELILSEFQKEEILSCYVIGSINHSNQISIFFNKELIFSQDRVLLQQTWSETSFHMQSLRDNPRCAKKQYETIIDKEDPGLNVLLSFDPKEDITTPFLNIGKKPRVAILREQGTHSHTEMAAAFDRARFECIDVHMSDLQKNLITLTDFKGLAVCGGFSFGDVLGAGQGWAKRILFNPNLRDQFAAFFNRQDTFTLGLSNGCQMLTYLKELIPGASLWPTFMENYSEQFEARLSLVEVQKTNSIFLKNMEGSRLLVPVAHKEGRVQFLKEGIEEEVLKQKLVALRYVDNWGRKTKTYPANPNGSSLGMTGFTTLDGRVLIMMPHPDRAFRTVQYSWHPDSESEDAPWLRLFRNARKWVG